MDMDDIDRSPVRIEGARELRRSLRKAGIALKDLKAVNKAAGDVVHGRASTTAPVGSRTKRARARRLKDTLRVFATSTGARIRAGAKSVPYAAPIHWGWAKRNIAAQPFISDAARATEPNWLRLYYQKITELVNSIQGAEAQ